MKLYKALSFCNEVEKVIAKKKTLTLLDAYIICERFRRKIGKKALNEKRYYPEGKPQKQMSFDEIMELQPPEIPVGEATYPVSEYVKHDFPVTSPMTPTNPDYKGVNKYEEFEKVIREKLSITVPNFFDVHVDPDYIKKHIEDKMRQLGGKAGKDEEIKRKTRVPYFWMTLEDPQEIWVNNDNNNHSKELSYVFFRQFKAQLDNGTIINLAMIVVVDENHSVTTYYSETGKKIPNIYKRRWGAKIFPSTTK